MKPQCFNGGGEAPGWGGGREENTEGEGGRKDNNTKDT